MRSGKMFYMRNSEECSWLPTCASALFEYALPGLSGIDHGKLTWLWGMAENISGTRSVCRRISSSFDGEFCASKPARRVHRSRGSRWSQSYIVGCNGQVSGHHNTASGILLRLTEAKAKAKTNTATGQNKEITPFRAS